MDWRTIMALAVLALPLTYCEVRTQDFGHKEKLACIEKQGSWQVTKRGKTCVFHYE